MVVDPEIMIADPADAPLPQIDLEDLDTLIARSVYA
jgi:hypothetical protein